MYFLCMYGSKNFLTSVGMRPDMVLYAQESQTNNCHTLILPVKYWIMRKWYVKLIEIFRFTPNGHQ